MGYTEKYIEQIREKIQASDPVLAEARTRQDTVLGVVASYPGTLRVYRSGSLAHFTVIKPVSDADCGVVLDRRTYPELGPDGEGVGPKEIVTDVRDEIGPKLREAYPDARLALTKRAIKVTSRDPVTEEEDPWVDLIVCLTRKDAPGLWIPHLKWNTWDASHPEKHTELFTTGSEAFRRVRRRAVRLAKAWNKQYAEPAVSSFNLEALALDVVKSDANVVDALLAIFKHGADQLSEGLTPDPAGVSDPIKCPDRKLAVRRLETAAAGVTEALEHDDDEDAVREALSKVFFDFVNAPEGASSKAAFADSIRRGSATLGPTTASRAARQVRSHGETR